MANEMSQTRRRYTREFKEEAVLLSERSDMTVRQAAKDLGIPEKRLHIWRTEIRESRKNGTRFAPGNGRARDEELGRLKRENQQLRLERDTLRVKKAMAYLMPRSI
jgi:transposase